MGRKEDGAGGKRGGVQRTTFMIILSRMSRKTSGAFQLGKICKPADVVLHLCITGKHTELLLWKKGRVP